MRRTHRQLLNRPTAGVAAIAAVVTALAALTVSVAGSASAGTTGTAKHGALAADKDTRSASSASRAFTGEEGTYVPLTITRIVDTGAGLGTAKAKLGAGQSITVQVSGKGGIPASGVSAAVLNVSIVGGTASSTYLKVYPAGGSLPLGPAVDAEKTTVRNLVTTKLGTGGKVTIYNARGSVNVLVDAVGWYADATSTTTKSGEFQQTTVQRLTDTRTTSKLLGRQTLTQPVDYSGTTTNPGIDNTKIRALAVSISVLGASRAGTLLAWNGSKTVPTSAVLSFAEDASVTNLAIVPTGPCTLCTGSAKNLPSITIKNSSDGTINVLIDIYGLYDDGTIHGGAARRSTRSARRSGSWTPASTRAPRPSPERSRTAHPHAEHGGRRLDRDAGDQRAVAPEGRHDADVLPDGRPSAQPVDPGAHAPQGGQRGDVGVRAAELLELVQHVQHRRGNNVLMDVVGTMEIPS